MNDTCHIFSFCSIKKVLPGHIALQIAGCATLAQAVYTSGFLSAPALCSGLGLCGQCQMRITMLAPPSSAKDRAYFSEKELAEGWRLGCCHAPKEGMVVIVSVKVPARNEAPPQKKQTTIKQKAALAIDVGTTSLHWQLFSPEGSPLADAGSMLNPQMGAGSDIISRLEAAKNRLLRKRMAHLVIEAIQTIVHDAKAAGYSLDALCLAANPAMTAIVLDRDISGLAAAPYSLPVQGGGWETIDKLPPLWVPPQISPFVGGDVTAGYAAIALASQHLLMPNIPQRAVTYPFLLADLGTNGEFILALSPEKALAASVALGPALEGIGLFFGTTAHEGAITGFSLTPAGLVPEYYRDQTSGSKMVTHAISGTSCANSAGSIHTGANAGRSGNAGLGVTGQGITGVGITGTGYISLVHRLLAANALSRAGQFTEKESFLAKYFKHYQGLKKIRPVPGNDPFLSLPQGFFLRATDVEEILKVKAAFSLGLQRLLAHGGIAFSDLEAVYLAGALGEHVDLMALESLGFFPQGAQARVIGVGNAALKGAGLLACNDALQQRVITWAKQAVTPLILAEDTQFQQDFVHHMHFSWQP